MFFFEMELTYSLATVVSPVAATSEKEWFGSIIWYDYCSILLGYSAVSEARTLGRADANPRCTGAAAIHREERDG